MLISGGGTNGGGGMSSAGGGGGGGGSSGVFSSSMILVSIGGGRMLIILCARPAASAQISSAWNATTAPMPIRRRRGSYACAPCCMLTGRSGIRDRQRVVEGKVVSGRGES